MGTWTKKQKTPLSNPEIETDIPLPDDKRKRYDWDKMQVGNAFFTESDPHGAISFQHRHSDRRYIYRLAVKNGRRGWRVWRKS